MTLQWVSKLSQLTGVVLLFGWSVFQFVIVPIHPGATKADGADGMVLRRWRWAAVLGTLLITLGIIGQIVRIFGPLLSGLPLALKLRYGWLDVIESNVGRLQLTQLLLAAVFAVTVAVGARYMRSTARPAVVVGWRLSLVLTWAAMALAVVWGSHAVSSLSRWVALSAQWSHLVLVSLWAGGLLMLGSLPWRTLGADTARHGAFVMNGLRRLSGLGFVAVMVVVVSGAVLSALYVLNLSVAAGSWYGRGVALKIGLLLVIVVIAGVNRLWLLPKLREPDSGSAQLFQRIGRLLRLEAVIVATIVVVSAVVTQLPPPSTPGIMEAREWTVEAGPLVLDVFAGSEGAADVRFEIIVRDRSSGQRMDVDEFELQVDMPGHFMGINPMVVPPTSQGYYVAYPPISMAGPWTAGIVIQDGGEVHIATVNFQVTRASFEEHSRLQRLLAGHPISAVSLILSVVAVTVGVGLWLSPTGFGARRAEWGVIALGALLIGVGALWVAQLTGLATIGIGNDAGTVRRAAADGPSGMPHPMTESGGDTSGLLLAADADQFLLRVAVHPATLGRNSFRVHLQDYYGDPVAGVGVRATFVHPSSGESLEFLLNVEGDGMTYTADVELATEGVWRLLLEVLEEGGSTAIADASLNIPVPVGGAKDLLRMADEAMNRLHSVRLREEMRGRPDGILITDLEFAAPDRSSQRSSVGREMIIIDDTRYLRLGTEQEWTVGRWPQERGYRWPDFDYAELGTRYTLLGRDEVDGRPVWVVSFIQEPLDIRYVLWIDAETYLIHRLTMLTTGHYMYWTFYDFNEPIIIEPPVDADP